MGLGFSCAAKDIKKVSRGVSFCELKEPRNVQRSFYWTEVDNRLLGGGSNENQPKLGEISKHASIR